MAKKAASSEAPQLNKSQVIKAILDSGIEKPAEILTVAKEQYGQDIAKPFINTVKSGWKKAKGGSVNNGKKVSRKLPKSATKTPVSGGHSENGGKVSKLTAIDVAIELVEAFGADKAREMIKVMGDTRGNG